MKEITNVSEIEVSGGAAILCCNKRREWKTHRFGFYWTFCTGCLNLYLLGDTIGKYMEWRDLNRENYTIHKEKGSWKIPRKAARSKKPSKKV